MVDTVVRFDFFLFAITCFEVGAILWLLPLGTWPGGGIRKQRLGRFLSPLMVLLALSAVFLPPNINPVATGKAWVLAALTPLWLGLAVFETVVLVRAWRQLHSRRQDML